MPDPLDPILADLPTAIDQQRRNPSIAGPSWCIAGSRTLRYQYCNRAQQRHDPLRIEPLLFDKTKAAFEAYVLTKLGLKKQVRSLSSFRYLWLSQQCLPGFYGLGQVLIHSLLGLTDATSLNGIKNFAMIFVRAATATVVGEIEATTLSGEFIE